MRIEFDNPIHDIELLFVGIDPGNRNLGIAILDIPTKQNVVFQADLYQITFAQRAVDVLGRMKAVMEVLDGLCIPKYPKSVIIEGAAYGEQFRQAELEDVRAGAAIWFDKHNSAVQIIAPNTVRKNAFGSQVKAQEYWKELAKFPDAAAALSCAVCCLS